MAKLTPVKTSFTAGEISSRLLGRGDLVAYENGAYKLRNVYVHPTGGVSRRSGLRYIDTAAGKARLASFEFNTEQIYLLVISDLNIAVYRDEQKVADITTPWTEAQLSQLVWVQSADTLLLVHPDVEPKKISRTSDTDWTIENWSYFHDEEDSADRLQQPMHKFVTDDVSLTTSVTSGTITVTASEDVFDSNHVGVRFRIGDKEIEISTVTSATVATAVVKETLSATTATKDWEEQAFSPVRGWPTTVVFHQDRMVIGGSRDLPNRLWFSKSADLFNFDLGEGLDDESIEFAILSDQVNAIRATFSGRHFQVLTSGAEWMVSGDPLTPGNIQLNRQTRVGSPVDRIVPPRDVDGATIFIPRKGPELNEFLFADVEQAYTASNLASLAPHMIDAPVDQDYDATSRVLHLVMQDGNLSMLTIYRSEKVTAWTRCETDGNFHAVVVNGDAVYVLVERSGSYEIEVFDDDLSVDSGLSGTDVSAKTTWSGLDHLEGKSVKVLADGSVHEDAIVTSGLITLSEPANSIVIGLAFTHIIEPLPPAIQGIQGGNQGGKLRPVSHTFRLKETSSLRLDTGRGFNNIPFKGFGVTVLDQPPLAFTGDITVRCLGWRRDGTKPLWRIEQDTPLPFTLLSVASELNVNG